MGRYSELIQKEVINLQDGSVLGTIRDLEMDYGTGQVRSIILQGESRFLGFLGSCSEWVIPWRCIGKIGDDIIVVDIVLDHCRREV
jgi:YlmC/YmxH family sporulation protein